MRILHIVPGYYPDFAAPYEYSRQLARLGANVTVIAFKRLYEAETETIDGMKVIRIPVSARSSFSHKKIWSFLPQVLYYLDNQYYDLVHVYAFRGCCLSTLIARKCAYGWIVDIRTGNTSSKAQAANFLTRLECKVYDEIIVLDKAVGKFILSPANVFMLYPWAQTLLALRLGAIKCCANSSEFGIMTCCWPFLVDITIHYARRNGLFKPLLWRHSAAHN